MELKQKLTKEQKANINRWARRVQAEVRALKSRKAQVIFKPGKAPEIIHDITKEPHKGFKRSAKEWEETLATHMGKFFDKLDLDDFIAITLGIYGYYKTRDPSVALMGIMGWKLARTMGGGWFSSQTAGLATLAAYGLILLPWEELRKDFMEWTPKYPDWWPFKSEFGKYVYFR